MDSYNCDEDAFSLYSATKDIKNGNPDSYDD